MKLLKRFSQQLEGQMCHNLLAANGIESQLVGAKDYVSHVMGGDLGRYQLLVHEDDWAQALKLLNESPPEGETAEALSTGPDHFRQSLFLAFAAMVILPVIFNIASLRAAREFWRESHHDTLARLKLALLMAAQLPAAVLIYYLVRAAVR